MNPDNDMTAPACTLTFLDSETSIPNHPVRVWLVDDDSGFRSLLAQMLAEASGFDCSREFASAETLLEALASEPPPDVILLDNQMSGQYGVDALRPIKALAPSTRVLMLTTCFDSQLRQRVLHDGAADFLQKFYSVEKIAQRIRAALAGPVDNGFAPPPAEENPAGVEPWASTAAIRAERSVGKDRCDRCQPPAAGSRPPPRGRRAAWAHAAERLVRGTYQVRFWLSMFF